jgi:DNA-directed RNA polymerase subunit RPC12/RpoP
MTLEDPVVVYDAANNLEAQMVKLLLVAAGIEAFASEDVSTAGLWMFGMLPEIHKPQVWVSRSDAEAALPILEGYERDVAQRNQVNQQPESNDESAVNVVCEECGKSSTFPSVQRGAVQDCPHCGSYVDVGEIDESDAFWREGGEEEET